MSTVVPVLAPVSGEISEIRVESGSTVRAGDVLVVQNVTKTETSVSSPSAGQVKLLVEKGVQVRQGDRIAEISF